MSSRRVLANAVVDEIKKAPVIGGLGLFRVEVWGVSPHDFVRIYEIREKDDNNAAREGLQRFVEEMERLDSAEE